MDPALKDAIVFHSNLNPAIWGDEKMLPEVREDLMRIMDDFREFLAVDDLDIVDITVSGSNAAYTYTPHSDIDLHLVVRVPESQDKIFTELFDAKKALYNLTRNIKVRGFDVELYVQNDNNPVQSMGIYSVLRDQWIAYPRRVKAEVNDVSVMARVRIYTHRINEALASDDIELAKQVWRDLRAMRKAGLDKGGEFSPENLAFKILRTRDMANKLYDHIIALKDKSLSLEHIEEQRVDELFDAPAKKLVLSDTDREYKVQSVINGRVIVFVAKYMHYLRDSDGWSLSFHERASYGDDVGLTGNGKEFDVLGFVKSCIDILIEKHDPNYLTFASAHTKHDSRTGTYERMVHRFLSNRYEVIKYRDDTGTDFILKKIA